MTMPASCTGCMQSVLGSCMIHLWCSGSADHMGSLTHTVGSLWRWWTIGWCNQSHRWSCIQSHWLRDFAPCERSPSRLAAQQPVSLARLVGLTERTPDLFRSRNCRVWQWSSGGSAFFSRFPFVGCFGWGSGSCSRHPSIGSPCLRDWLGQSRDSLRTQCRTRHLRRSSRSNVPSLWLLAQLSYRSWEWSFRGQFGRHWQDPIGVVLFQQQWHLRACVGTP